jgi:hypothetical protein
VKVEALKNQVLAMQQRMRELSRGRFAQPVDYVAPIMGSDELKRKELKKRRDELQAALKRKV